MVITWKIQKYNHNERLEGYQLVDFFIPSQPWQAVCIEGVSDNQEEFMTNHFNK